MADWRYNIGDNINDGRRNLTITDREIRYMSHYKHPCHQKWDKYTCNICGWTEGWITEKNLYEGKGCSCCHGNIVVKGINDLATKAPYVIPYLVDIEDAYKYTPSSSRIIKTKCPICGDIRDYRISQLTKNAYICHRCGIHVSAPEKLFYEFLKMYNIDFIPQLSSAKMKWCKQYRYDFYIPCISTIVEIHGKQHYELGIYSRSYENIHEIDEIKKRLAMENEIKHYCIIPLTRSEKDTMIDVLLNHEIMTLLNIDKRDLKDNLNKCFANTFGNQMQEICEYYTQHPELSAVKIAKHFGISSPTVLKALHNGTDFGLCLYDGQAILKRVRGKNWTINSKKIEVTDINGKKFEFPSIRETERMSDQVFNRHFSRFFIKKHCKNGELLDGYRFRYIS